jgi:hypothetical protein
VWQINGTATALSVSRQSEIYRTLRAGRRISIDDILADGEIERCRAEREQRNGNGKCPKRIAARLALIPEAIRLADAEINIAANVGLWTLIYKRHLIRLSESLRQTDNRSASRNGSQNCETKAVGCNGQAEKSGHSSAIVEPQRVQCWRAKTDETGVALPVW